MSRSAERQPVLAQDDRMDKRVTVAGAVLGLATLMAACERDPGKPSPSPSPSPSPAAPSPASSTAHTDPAEAAARLLCERALQGSEVLSGTPTTVGEIRGWRIGPGVQMAENSFKGLPDDTAGAWCWTREGPSSYRSFGVALPTREAVAFMTMRDDSGTPPSGPPRAP